jgi:circadian clock protein KaiC
LSALLARLADAVQRVSAVRVSLDSIGAVFSRFNDSRIVRLELTRTARTLRELNVTAVLTSERTEEYGAISRFEVEEFVADNVVILRNVLDREKRRRTLEVLKLRGSPHRTGEWLFTIDPVKGLVVLPLALLGMDQPPSSERVSAGVPELDRMFAGGLFRDSVAFVAGPTGTGKTLLATHFIQAGVDAGERCVIFSFEDTREQLLRNAASWGFDLEAMEATGRLQIMCEYPELASLEDHYLSVTRLIEEFKPQRLVVDNMSALERVTSERGMRDVVIGLGAFVKQRQITTLFTASTDIVGGSGMTEAHLSTLTDAIVLLRYVEMDAEMRRAITVLKMLGSSHDHAIREYTIGDAGVTIGEPLKGAGGFLPPSGGNGSAGGAGGS